MKHTRRRFLRTLGLGCAGLAVSACQPRAPLSPPAASPAAPTAAAPLTLPTAPSASAAKATVAIDKISSYDPQAVRQSLETLLDGIGGLGDVIRPGARVAVKINLTGGSWWPSKFTQPTTEIYLTHPQVVRSLCELLRDAGASKISIVEGLFEPDTWGVWGYDEVAKAVNAELVDLNKPEPYPGFTTMSPGINPFVYEDFTLNPILGEIDAFISVPKLKCHYTAGVTMAMKNLVGITPMGKYQKSPKDNNRTMIHGGFQDGVDHRLIGNILDLNRTRPVTLSIVDGIYTCEGGEGPWNKTMRARKANMMLAGKDPLATDVVCTAVMGFDPTAADRTAPFVRSENYLRMAGELGLGTFPLGDIYVAGASIDDVRLPFAVAEA